MQMEANSFDNFKKMHLDMQGMEKKIWSLENEVTKLKEDLLEMQQKSEAIDEEPDVALEPEVVSDTGK